MNLKLMPQLIPQKRIVEHFKILDDQIKIFDEQQNLFDKKSLTKKLFSSVNDGMKRLISTEKNQFINV